MAGIKELKTRIKSIGSTRKITRAMQMVSAAKMRKAQNAALNSRAYSALAGELVGDLTPASSGVILSESDEPRNPLSDDQELRDPSTHPQMHSGSVGMTINKLLVTYPNATKTGIIIISTNKGLVGGFNTNLLNKLREIEADPSTTPSSKATLGVTKSSDNLNLIAELLVMGRKAKEYAVRFNKNLVAEFPKSDTWAPIETIYPLAKMVTELYQSGQYKQILIIYSQFVSTLTQKATVKTLLPFGQSSDHVIASPSASEGVAISSKGKIASDALAMTSMGSGYLFEPSPTEVLEHLLPRIIESQIYQAVLESDASEHSARMVMMKNATEAAGDLISDLTLTYNQLRQNKITTELSEITAGRIALE